MYRKLRVLYNLLSDEQRQKLFSLQVLVIFMAFAEVASVLSIGPFMAVVGDIGQLQGDNTLADLYRWTGFEEPSDFLFWLGIVVFGILALATSISIFTVWRLSLYGQQVGAELSTRLYKHYMQQPWLFHAGGSSSQLTNKIAQECGRITNQIITPLMQMNAKAVMALFMSLAIFVFNPKVAIIGLFIFGSAYIVLYRTVRRKLARNGKAITQANRQRFKLMNEGFGGVKDTLLLGRQADFNRRFEEESKKFGRAQGITKGLSQAPRYAMELIAFGAVIFLVLYLLVLHEGNLGSILPVLSVYALAGFKLLPAFQQVYTSIAQVRGNLAAMENLEEDLRESQDAVTGNFPEEAGLWLPKREIKLEDITFKYPGKEEAALKSANLKLPINKVIGIVGASGSGKSTMIDVILGLIDPELGKLTVDGVSVTYENKRAWQNSIGFVPQSIFLADASIGENIAFGLPLERIDNERVKRAAKMAHLDELLTRLPDGLNTRVGERGVQLSGGQRQRIGIARALYDDAVVLVLDEATSALDGITEKLVMDAIHDFSGKKTIIMIAHRLATVRQCDIIYLMEDGSVTDSGNFDDLVSRNKKFQKMANHA
ncbi:MAG: ABC transporter ATP-binding protein/permease [Balneolaceae bacterium]|nr:ABC transporter ATP-binding protein/permease [Balneolaceae bacterium]